MIRFPQPSVEQWIVVGLIFAMDSRDDPDPRLNIVRAIGSMFVIQASPPEDPSPPPPPPPNKRSCGGGGEDNKFYVFF